MPPSTTSATTTALLPKDSRSRIRPSSQPRTSLSSGIPNGPGSQWSPENRSGPRAKRLASPAWSRPSRCTPTYSPLATAGHADADRAMLKVNRGGSAESDASDVAVKPYGTPSQTAVRIATPAAWWRNASRKSSVRSAACRCRAAWRWGGPVGCAVPVAERMVREPWRPPAAAAVRFGRASRLSPDPAGRICRPGMPPRMPAGLPAGDDGGWRNRRAGRVNREAAPGRRPARAARRRRIGG